MYNILISTTEVDKGIGHIIKAHVCCLKILKQNILLLFCMTVTFCLEFYRSKNTLPSKIPKSDTFLWIKKEKKKKCLLSD